MSILAERPALAGLLEPLAQQRRLGDEALGEAVHALSAALAKIRFSWAWAATSVDRLCRSRTALEPLRRAAADGPETAK